VKGGCYRFAFGDIDLENKLFPVTKIKVIFRDPIGICGCRLFICRLIGIKIYSEVDIEITGLYEAGVVNLIHVPPDGIEETLI